MKKATWRAIAIFSLIVLAGLLVIIARGGEFPLSVQQQEEGTGEVETRLVNVKFAVQDAYSYSDISGAEIYVWTSQYIGDAVEVLTTDSTGTVTSQATYETGTTLYIFVKATGYYPTAQAIRIPSTGLASEQTLVTLPAIRLYKASTSVSLSGSTIGPYAFTAGGSGTLTTAFKLDIKIGSIDSNSVYGADMYTDYSTSQRYQYLGPVIIVRVNASIVTPETPVYNEGSNFDGTYYYYVFIGSRVYNDADDPYDGQEIFSTQWKILSSGVVSISIYVLDSVRADNLSIPWNLLGSADASIVGFVATVS